MKLNFDLPGNPKYESILPSDVYFELRCPQNPSPPVNWKNYWETYKAKEIEQLKEKISHLKQLVIFQALVIAVVLAAFWHSIS